jgi:lysozyme
MMRTSDAGLVALARHEGIVLAPYRDSVGVWTYGVGHTRAAGPPDPAALAFGLPADLDAAMRRVLDLFRRDLLVYEAAVSAALTRPVTQHAFDALVSFHYNTGGIRRAKLTEHLNAGRLEAAAQGFSGWMRPPEIRPRRLAEQALFRTGVYPSGRIAVYSADGKGRLSRRPIQQMDPDALLALLRDPAPTPF